MLPPSSLYQTAASGAYRLLGLQNSPVPPHFHPITQTAPTASILRGTTFFLKVDSLYWTLHHRNTSSHRTNNSFKKKVLLRCIRKFLNLLPVWKTQKRTCSLELHYCEAQRSLTPITKSIIFSKYIKGNMDHLKKWRKRKYLQRYNRDKKLSELSNIAEVSLN